jgi:hypothetical protein
MGQDSQDDVSMREATEVLDLTNSHLRNLDGVQIDPGLKVHSTGQGAGIFGTCNMFTRKAVDNMQVLDLTANRLTQFDPRILALTGKTTAIVVCCSSVKQGLQP